jgi:hypothetical protein
VVFTLTLAPVTLQVSRLAMLSLLAVFKDIIPGYRIRLPTEKELEVKVCGWGASTSGTAHLVLLNCLYNCTM